MEWIAGLGMMKKMRLPAATRDSNGIVTFRIDFGTGLLKPEGEPASVPTPGSIVFAGL